MANSINTNIAAYYAQANISLAARLASDSVARLSSGNAIVRASDNVTGLAIGTKLATSVSTLRTALLNTAQGSSLLQVADGALSQITDILSRQKAIAQQAGSGTLQNADRAFLDQEFQSLADEIDRLTESTTFNGVKLINGSISGALKLNTNTNDGTTTSISSSTIVSFLNTATLPASGETLTIQGVTVTFTSADQGSTAAAGKVSIGGTKEDTALNLVNYLNQLGDPRLANLEFTTFAVGSTTVTGTVFVRWTGGDGPTSGSVSVTVSNTFAATTANTTANGTITIATVQDGLGIDRTSYTGNITGNIFVNGGNGTTGTDASRAGPPLDLSGVYNNEAFVGRFGQGAGHIGAITATVTTTDTAIFSLVVGDYTYTTAAEDLTNAAAASVLEFTGRDSLGNLKGGTFIIRLDGDAVATFSSQGQLDAYVNQINNGLSSVVVQQNRDVLGFDTDNTAYLGSQQVANFGGFSFDFRSDDFSSVKIESIKITAPGVGETDAIFEFRINGEIYRSLSGIGNQIGKSKIIALQNLSDPTKVFTMVTGQSQIPDSSTTTMDLGTQAKADAVAAGLELAFGLSEAGDSLSFQIGSAATDVLGVSIGGATTEDLYGGEALNVLTQEDAANAADVLDGALDTATSLRATVGALLSRFNFAASTLQVTIQNQDAARSGLLDTDIAAEATMYATSQVKLQAGISVLAQANQQLQSLLKLIG